MQENNSQLIIYQTESGETKLDVRFQDETVWLTQKLMAELIKDLNFSFLPLLDNLKVYKYNKTLSYLILINSSLFADVIQWIDRSKEVF